MTTAAELIAALDLKPLPLEGGYYRETYRSADVLSADAWPARYRTEKAAGTAIYYLLTSDTFSTLHRLPTDEVFHLYLGGPVHMLQLGPDGGRVVTLGTNMQNGQRPQLVVPCGVWQGSWLAAGAAFALMGTTMAPGFDFADYEAADGAALAARYPEFVNLIQRLLPEPPSAGAGETGALTSSTPPAPPPASQSARGTGCS